MFLGDIQGTYSTKRFAQASFPTNYILTYTNNRDSNPCQASELRRKELHETSLLTVLKLPFMKNDQKFFCMAAHCPILMQKNGIRSHFFPSFIYVKTSPPPKQ